MIAGAWLFINIRAALRAENCLIAFHDAMQSVKDYTASKHRWPKSWDDLATTRTPQEEGDNDWISRLSQRIIIDFDVSTEGIRKADAQSFRLIRYKDSKSPVYVVSQYELEEFCASVRSDLGLDPTED